MPYRKLAGFNKQGEPWVNPNLPQRLQSRIMVHQREYARCRLQGKPHDVAVERARIREHKGMTQRGVQLYELDIARRTKDLKGRMSYSPLRKNRD